MTLLIAVLLSLPIPTPPLGATMGTGRIQPVTQTIAVAGDSGGSGATTTQLPATGWATYYGRGIFPGVVERQIGWSNIQPDTCPDCLGYAAMLWPGDLDRIVCIVEGGRVYRLWVVDSAAGHHRQALIADGWLIDLQRSVWDELGFWNAPTLVTVTECSS